ncbi:stage III sporulation protein AA [Paraliobacillus quinghaiensis]|uniref:Stage III sporulation protein AA n=1 Tax=Paraliobacillus quinghaiensis TaxID=470815 RepID=A0A917WY56_9BACI|nr:stage III sporulation protein AA [Paraliobacillus quinghaiensis]GGM40202.1 stage III sporulation protein AA [Paraliobacillus quinghaiensis]
MLDEIIRLFPGHFKGIILDKVGVRWGSLQEIRVRVGRPIELVFDQNTEWLNNLIPTKSDSLSLLNQLSQFSLYRMEDELKQGYITIQGGHRVGLAGKVNTINGSVKAIKDITSFNIRIAKAKHGIANPYMGYLFQRKYLNTLIIGPPQTGKTTLLRDITRLISSGWGRVGSMKVGVVDERSEIAGCLEGVPQHDIGKRTDVLDACPKAEGMMMLIRSMSPDVLIVDEIGSKQDVEALQDAMHAGVRVICTIHGDSLEDIQKRSSFKPLWQERVFERFISLERTNKPGVVKHILSAEGRNLVRKPRGVSDEMDWSASAFDRHHLGRI